MQNPIFCWMCALLWKWTYAIYLSLSVSFYRIVFLLFSFFFLFAISFNTFVTILLILLLDIPLSCLEERKPEDVQLLKKKINQLKQGRSGDFQPKGNSKTPLHPGCALLSTWTCTYTYSQYSVPAGFWLLELLGDPFSKTVAVNLCSWSALVTLIYKTVFWW